MKLRVVFKLSARGGCDPPEQTVSGCKSIFQTLRYHSVVVRPSMAVWAYLKMDWFSMQEQDKRLQSSDFLRRALEPRSALHITSQTVASYLLAVQDQTMLPSSRRASGDISNQTISSYRSVSRFAGAISMLNLRPFLDSEGLLRVSGRLFNSSINKTLVSQAMWLTGSR